MQLEISHRVNDDNIWKLLNIDLALQCSESIHLIYIVCWTVIFQDMFWIQTYV